MFVTESSFGAYVFHGRPAGLHRHQRLLLPCQAVGLGAPQTINGCHHGHFKALSSCRCRLVGSCVRPGENFLPYDHVCTFDIVTGNLTVDSIFVHHQIYERNEQVSLFLFSKLFFTPFLYHGDQKSMISWWRICSWQAVDFEIHL